MIDNGYALLVHVHESFCFQFCLEFNGSEMPKRLNKNLRLFLMIVQKWKHCCIFYSKYYTIVLYYWSYPLAQLHNTCTKNTMVSFLELKDEVDLLYSCGIVWFSSFIKDTGEERVHQIHWRHHQHRKPLDPRIFPHTCICLWLSPVRFLWGSHVSLLPWIAMLHYNITTLSAGGPTFGLDSNRLQH